MGAQGYRVRCCITWGRALLVGKNSLATHSLSATGNNQAPCSSCRRVWNRKGYAGGGHSGTCSWIILPVQELYPSSQTQRRCRRESASDPTEPTWHLEWIGCTTKTKREKRHHASADRLTSVLINVGQSLSGVTESNRDFSGVSYLSRKISPRDRTLQERHHCLPPTRCRADRIHQDWPIELAGRIEQICCVF